LKLNKLTPGTKFPKTHIYGKNGTFWEKFPQKWEYLG